MRLLSFFVVFVAVVQISAKDNATKQHLFEDHQQQVDHAPLLRWQQFAHTMDINMFG